MSIVNTIRNLKPGDMVRVTREQTVGEVYPSCAWPTYGAVITPTDPTITSIEVLSRPLAVGDRVMRSQTGQIVIITAIGRKSALVDLEGVDDELRIYLTDLRRVS